MQGAVGRNDTESIMNRILIIGSGGAGKSTAAKCLHELTGLPLIHLDSFYWKPNWIESPKQEWDETLKGLCKKPQWIMDGNYGRTLDYRISKADTILFLHFSRFICLKGAIVRRLFGKRVDVIPGCPERMDLAFLSWIWHYNTSRAPGIMKKLEKVENKTIHILKNRRELQRLLRDIECNP